MVDLDAAQSLDDLFPRLKPELHILQNEVLQLMLNKTPDVHTYVDVLGRMIAVLAKKHQISIFAAATRAVQRTEFREIPLIVAIAAALEVAAAEWQATDFVYGPKN